MLNEKTVSNAWVPSCKVYLYHSANDYYVPTVCGDRMYEYLKKVGADVEYNKFDAPHVEGGLLMEVEFLNYLTK